MATLYRRRFDAIGGLVEDNPLTAGATTLTSSGLQYLPTVGTDEYYAIKLDPDGVDGTPETAFITAHTLGTNTATIARGQEGTTARACDRDTPWVHTLTARDFDGRDGGSGLLAYTQYAAGTDGTPGSGTWNTSSATGADVDAANLAVTFTPPPSGKVLTVLTALSQVTGASGTAGPIAWGIRQSTTDLFYDTVQMELSTSADYARFSLRRVYSGLTPGTPVTWKWAWKLINTTGSPNARIHTGPNDGPAVMEVWGVNV